LSGTSKSVSCFDELRKRFTPDGTIQNRSQFPPALLPSAKSPPKKMLSKTPLYPGTADDTSALETLSFPKL